MIQHPMSLDDLRSKIDEIDAAMHDLLMLRAETALAIGTQKGAAPVWRPAREAQVMRRLAERHAGPFPKPALMQIWREIISAMAGLQGDLTTAVFATGDQQALLSMARDHFGAAASLESLDTTKAVVDAVRCGEARIGLLPDLEPDPEGSWWRYLATIPQPRPVVCARLPFVRSAETAIAAYCIACVDAEASGDDFTVLALHTTGGVEKADLEAELRSLGVKPERLIGSGSGYVAELRGFDSLSEARGKAPSAAQGCALDMIPLGAYAAPVAID